MKIETSPGNLKFKKEQQLSRCTKSDVENNGWGWQMERACANHQHRRGRRDRAVAGIHAKCGHQYFFRVTPGRDYMRYPMYKCLVYIWWVSAVISSVLSLLDSR